uniref:Uncharacterized protein At4g38062 family n=1 Tax=Cajanus cajan TaxID=3821 RepID=A0A151RE73_CAJCA|nr:Uncharacterized protein At4g38062 family [Cajanus cajan]
MAKVYEELDEAKAEIEELKAELRAKTDSFENLKKSYNAQVNQIQEAKSKAERQDQKLFQQAYEISETKSVCEDLKEDLNKKESIIKHLSAANDKLRVDCNDKFKRWEEEKRGLVLALEEANEKSQNQEQQNYLYKQEIERLKGCLSVSKEKCFETEKKIKVSKELRERDDLFQKLEEESRRVEEQLKWKKEQFNHLEEAYEKLRDQFKSSKKEWEMEKSTLLDEISSLQTKLDSQIRISEDLQHQLQSCHQALAHVESQKKRLEVEVSNLKVELDNASNEYQDARLQLDCLNTDRDKDIADLRYLLKTKEAYHKESKYRIEKLEQENQELRTSLKELQEAQIQEAGASYSQSKLRSKLRNLEQTHKECASTLKAKEAEWSFKLKQLTEDLNICQELETSLLAQVDVCERLKQEKNILVFKLEEKERTLDYLQQDVVLLEHEPRTRGESAVSSESDNVRYLRIIAEKDKTLEELQKEVVWLEQEIFRREFESAVIEKGTVERTFEHEKDNLIQLVKGKGKRMDELMLQVTSLEQQFTNSLTSLSSQLVEKQAEINLIREACDKITASQILAALEIEEKKLMVVELEDDIQAIQQKVKLQEEKWSQSEQLALDTEVELGAKQSKVMELNDQMETNLRKSDALVQKLKMENRNLLENATRLSSERENMLAFVQGFSDKICEFSTADTLLMDKLKSMVLSFENGYPVMTLKKDASFIVKENMLIQSPTRIRKLEANSDKRSPFKELNLLEE